MSTLFQVDPASFVSPSAGTPATGRGAWTKRGIEFEYRYALSEDPAARIGTRAEVSLDHWAVSAGSWAIQLRLGALGFLSGLADSERGIFGPRTQAAVKAFQQATKDPKTSTQLSVDGIVGTSDARALFTPILRRAEALYSIPNRLLTGETVHESMLDPGAVGYYIYYPDYRGVDRGMSQINSRSNTSVSWLQAFDPSFSIDWSGKRLRTYYDQFRASYPKTSLSSLWDAAVCAHNNPSAASAWARLGEAPTQAAADYVAAVKLAVY